MVLAVLEDRRLLLALEVPVKKTQNYFNVSRFVFKLNLTQPIYF